MNRVALYCFYDSKGHFAKYNYYYLNALKEVSDRIIVIVNGNIQQEALECLKNSEFEIIIRENTGFDFEAWKQAFFSLNQSELQNIDELILCNNSCYGPTVSFKTIWEVMKNRDCDFWGIYEYPEDKYFPRHLQSYFLVIKKELFTSEFFKNYLKNLRISRTLKEAVGIETSFTQKMEKAGYKFSSFAVTDEYISNPTVVSPLRCLEKGFPLIKRKAFTNKYDEIFDHSFGFEASEVFDWLDENSSFSKNLIIDDICQQMPSSKIINSLKLSFGISECCENCESRVLNSDKKIAVILYSYYEDLVKLNMCYLKNLPKNSTIFIVAINKRVIDFWKRSLASDDSLKHCKIIFRIQENKGRNESAFWVTCRDVMQTYDYICCLHDKKSVTAEEKLMGREWYLHCLNGLLKTEKYVSNIINVFDTRPYIGLLMPLTPLFSTLTDGITNNPWLTNKELAMELYNKLKLTVPFDERPRCPWGGMFWIRGKSTEVMFRHNWSFEDFPAEPIKPDGTILHVLERMYPTIVQEAGYLTAEVSASGMLGKYYNNLFYINQKLLSRKLDEAQPKNFSYLKKVLRGYIKGKVTHNRVVSSKMMKKAFREYIKYKILKILSG